MTAPEFTEWMERHKLSVRKVSAMFDIAPGTVQRYRSGRTAVPRLVVIACAYYDLATGALYQFLG